MPRAKLQTLTEQMFSHLRRLRGKRQTVDNYCSPALLDCSLWSCPSIEVFSDWAMARNAMICITVAVTEEASSTPTVTVA